MWQLQYPDVAATEAVKEWLRARRGSARPPEITARVLVAMVDCFEHDAPWPIRKDTARILQASEFSIDSARNTAILRGDVTEEYRFRQATGMKTIKRAAVVRERYYIPCSELLAVVRALRRRDVQLSKD